MRSILYILLFLLASAELLAQQRAVQIARGDSRELELVISTMEWIEINKPENVISKLLNPGETDSLIIEGCAYVAKNYPPTKGQWATFLNDTDTVYSFERTFYEQTGREVRFVYQVYIQQVKVDNEWLLSRVEFRDSSTLEPRYSELSDLTDDSTPPPPPPPGLE